MKLPLYFDYACPWAYLGSCRAEAYFAEVGATIDFVPVYLAALREPTAGQLDLDADVSPLLGWTLRHPAHPDVPISLRLLLSHTSGITDAAGYWQVPLDGEVRDLLADPRAWDAAHAPGGWFRYANLNFPLVAAVMERGIGPKPPPPAEKGGI